MRRTTARLVLVLVISTAGCQKADSPDAAPPVPKVDVDLDGYSPEEGDCNDHDETIHPGAPDPCNGKDDNCDGDFDEGFDNDHDHVTVCQGDCADNDPKTRPGATELLDGLDNDCDGIIDNHNASFDDDSDGYTEEAGDCDDAQALVNPGAIEVQVGDDGMPEGVDNDCDGEVDEEEAGCEDVAAGSGPESYARAIELCERVASARFEAPTDLRARRIVSDFGDVYRPRAGDEMIVLSTGIAGDEGEPWYLVVDPGTDFGPANVHEHPAPMPAMGCSGPDPDEVNDYAELRLELRVPTNARSFSFDFNFLSSEYPEFVCTDFDDTFMAILDSGAFKGNVSLDAMGNPVSINIAFFTVCDPSLGSDCGGEADLVGTGYQNAMGGGTGWLTTTSPVIPGEKMVLRFILFDEGDHILDSSVLIDNFRWHLTAVEAPTTEG